MMMLSSSAGRSISLAFSGVPFRETKYRKLVAFIFGPDIIRGERSGGANMQRRDLNTAVLREVLIDRTVDDPEYMFRLVIDLYQCLESLADRVQAVAGSEPEELQRAHMLLLGQRT